MSSGRRRFGSTAGRTGSDQGRQTMLVSVVSWPSFLWWACWIAAACPRIHGPPTGAGAGRSQPIGLRDGMLCGRLAGSGPRSRQAWPQGPTFRAPVPAKPREIRLDNCRERRLEDTCFGNQGIVFMRISPLREDILALAQCVAYARIVRPVRNGAWNFRHPVLKPFPRALSQAIEQLQKIVGLYRRLVAFSAVPCLQTDLDREGQ